MSVAGPKGPQVKGPPRGPHRAPRGPKGPLGPPGAPVGPRDFPSGSVVEAIYREWYPSKIETAKW